MRGLNTGQLARREDDDVPRRLALLTSDAPGEDPRARARATAGLAGALASSARAAGGFAVASGRWLTDLVVEYAPHLPVRDLDTLRAHHGGLSGDDLADAMIAATARVTAGIGAAGGALGSVEWTVPPLLLSAPVLLAAETLAVVAAEVKLVAELHQVYGVVVPGGPAQRAGAYVTAWVHRRAVPTGNPLESGLAPALTVAARRELRHRLLRRAGRNTTTFGPFLTGAVAAAELNRRETRRLGEAVARDLRRR